MRVNIKKSSSNELLERKVGVVEPVSPSAQYLNSGELCLYILAVFETDIPIDDSAASTILENLFLPMNHRFSSIMEKDENDELVWKKVEVTLRNHIEAPKFPSGFDLYDDHVQEYFSKIATIPLPETQPLWNLHIIKYPTKNSAGTLIFKLHHSLGDGFSLMSALFSCLRRADDPSLPLTFPSNSVKSDGKKWKYIEYVQNGVSMCLNTVRDVSGMLVSGMMKDSKSAIRSGAVDVETKPITLSTVEFPLSDIKQIKNKVNGTVNDTITGIVFNGLQLYLQSKSDKIVKPKNITALVLLNTRVIKAYQPLEGMTKKDTKAPWGNHFNFLHVSVPTAGNIEESDPLESIRQIKQIIKAKRNSLGVYITDGVLELIRKIKGPKAVSKYVSDTLRGASLAITNLIGPMEKIQMGNHPIRSFYFMVAGSPQSLVVTVVSYAGTLKVAIGAEKSFIDSEVLVHCMKESFQKIFEAAVGK